MANRGFFSVLVAGLSLITQFVKNITNTRTTQKKPTLNADTLLETLLRTCVKSLLRFQAASKSWFFLINHPHFIRLHLNFNFSRNSVLICNSLAYHRTHNLISFLRANGPRISVLEVDRRIHLEQESPVRINFRDFSRNMIICGSVDGIVCISNSGEFAMKYLGLWNPAIMQWKPVVLPKTKNWYKVSVGLGYDKVINDLKIVCIVPCRDESRGSVIEIYSVNNDTWEDVDQCREITFLAKRYQCNFIVKKVPYWTGSDIQAGSSEVLARIDPCTGFYQMLSYPIQIKENSVYPLNMKDSVVCLVESFRQNQNKMLDVYLLDENTLNWTVIYRLGPVDFMCVPQCLSSGEIVLVPGTSLLDEFYFCDPQTTRVIINREIQDLIPIWNESFSHVESLVSLKGMVLISKERMVLMSKGRMDKEPNPLLQSWKRLLPEDIGSVLHGAI